MESGNNLWNICYIHLMEKDTIFDENFMNAVRVRRRSLMSMGLKIYTWVMMVMGFGFFLLLITDPLFEMDEQHSLWSLVQESLDMIFMAIVFLGMAAGALILWLEYRWAVYLNAAMMMIYVGTIAWFMEQGASEEMVWYSLIFVPYWVMVLLISKRWVSIL